MFGIKKKQLITWTAGALTTAIGVVIFVPLVQKAIAAAKSAFGVKTA